jgi:hypothetical protein
MNTVMAYAATAGNCYTPYGHFYDCNITANASEEVIHFSWPSSAFINNSTSYATYCSLGMNFEYYVLTTVPNEVHSWYIAVASYNGTFTSGTTAITNRGSIAAELIQLTLANPALALSRGFPLRSARAARALLPKVPFTDLSAEATDARPPLHPTSGPANAGRAAPLAASLPAKRWA